MDRGAVGVRHRLAVAHRAASPEEVARSLVALHSTDPASVYLAVAARTAGPGCPVGDVDRALFRDRTLVRVLGMRRTLWAVPAELAPVVAAACGRAVAADERRKLRAAVEEQGLTTDGERFLARLEEQALAAMAGRGEARTADLAEDVLGLRRTIRLGGASKWAADVRLSTRIVLLLTAEGRAVRSRPVGGWTSGQYRYALAPPAGEPVATPAARVELARHWLASFGPASADPVGDLRWWAGWTVTATREALAGAGGPPADGPTAAGPTAAGIEPWAALLPGLDSTTMGWKQRSWYLGDLAGRLFDGNGNAGPTIWWNGEVVGGWAQRRTGEVVTRLLVDIGADGAAAVADEAARLQAWLEASGGVVRPRFPTPLQRELEA